jgi:clan AA aspartic protease
MIVGCMNARREATISITIIGPGGQCEVTAVIDTGYNGTLTLPQAMIVQAGLEVDATKKVTLGDRSERWLQFYRADERWHDTTRAISVLMVKGDALLGSALLDGSELCIQFKTNGPVTITPLSDPS